MIELEKLEEINEYIVEYMSHFCMSDSIEVFKKEIQTKMMAKRLRKKESLQHSTPRIVELFDEENPKSKTELNLSKQLKDLNKKYKLVIQGAR